MYAAEPDKFIDVIIKKYSYVSNILDIKLLCLRYISERSFRDVSNDLVDQALGRVEGAIPADVDGQLKLRKVMVDFNVDQLRLQLKYNFSSPKNCFNCINHGNVTDNYIILTSVYLCTNLIESSELESWFQYTSMFHLFCDVPCEDFLHRAKKLTTFAKSARERLMARWQLLCHIESFAGYILSVDLKSESKINEATEWCTGVVNQLDEFSDFEIIAAQNELLKDLSFKKSILDDEVISFDDFISRPDLWVSDGSSSQVSSEVRHELKSVDKNWKKNKTAYALSKTPSEIKAQLFAKGSPIIIKIAGKVEKPKKGRIFAVGPEELLIPMSYMDFYLRKVYSNFTPFSPLVMTTEEFHVWWVDLLRNCNLAKAKQRSWKFPYDAPSFDQKVGSDEMRWFFLFVKRCLNFLFNERLSHDLNMVCDLVIDRMEDWYLSLPNGELIRWEHGMPSGIKFTAFGDTIINITRMVLIKNKINSFVSTSLKWQIIGQGDDILIQSSWLSDLFIAYFVVLHLGFGAHKEKNWISNNSIEFLKKVVVKGQRSGYLMRAIPSYFLRDPLRKPLVPGFSRFQERADVCFTMLERGAKSSFVKSLLVKDLITSFGPNLRLQAVALIDAMSTPRAVDGLGVAWYDLSGFTSIVRVDTFNRKYEVRRLSGLWSSMASRLSNATGFDVSSVIRADVSNRVFVNTDVSEFVLARVNWTHKPMFFPVEKSVSVESNSDFQQWFPVVTLPKSVAQAIVLNIISDRQLSGLEKLTRVLEITDIDARGITGLIFKKWTRKLFVMWISGEIGPTVPLVVGVSRSVVSLIAKRLFAMASVKLFSKHRVDYNYYTSILLSVELHTVSFCKRYKYSYLFSE